MMIIMKEDDPGTINHVGFISWRNRFEQLKACKKLSKELMLVAQHPTRWWDWCILKDKKKTNRTIFDR